MATLMYCPKCKTAQECQKKGTKNGEQLWLCKECGKKFLDSAGQIPVKRTTKTVVEPRTVKERKVVEPKAITEIFVNNNVIKKIEKKLTVDQAFDMISNYFREIAKENVTITEKDGVTTIKFKVSTGTKG